MRHREEGTLSKVGNAIGRRSSHGNGELPPQYHGRMLSSAFWGCFGSLDVRMNMVLPANGMFTLMSKRVSRGELQEKATCDENADGQGGCHEDPSCTKQGIGEEKGREPAQPVTEEAPRGCACSCCSNCRADHHLL